MEAAFDAAATGYDAWFTHSPTGKLQRQRVHQYLQQHVLTTKPMRILELNCGTGEDAVWLAQQGHHVTATDVSTEMLRITEQKAQAAALQARVKVAPLDLSAPQLSATAASQPFDLVFSNFGGLNCINLTQFEALARFLATQLTSHGTFVAVIMPKQCRFEQLYFLAKGNPRQAFRRTTNEAVPVMVDGSTVPTWYFSARQIAQACQQHFNLRKKHAIGFFLPPSYLDPFFVKRPRLLNLLNRLEHTFGGLFTASDHLLLELQRK